MARKQMNIRLDRNTIEIIKAIAAEYDMSQAYARTILGKWMATYDPNQTPEERVLEDE